MPDIAKSTKAPDARASCGGSWPAGYGKRLRAVPGRDGNAILEKCWHCGIVRGSGILTQCWTDNPVSVGPRRRRTSSGVFRSQACLSPLLWLPQWLQHCDMCPQRLLALPQVIGRLTGHPIGGGAGCRENAGQLQRQGRRDAVQTLLEAGELIKGDMQRVCENSQSLTLVCSGEGRQHLQAQELTRMGWWGRRSLWHCC
jgi:hypothetical protein